MLVTAILSKDLFTVQSASAILVGSVVIEPDRRPDVRRARPTHPPRPGAGLRITGTST
ncbi:MAG: hypothetical protein R2713_22200 [Ilumatobacteraceae bacterium]